MLSAENLAFAEKLRAAGVSLETRTFPGTVHGFLRALGRVDAADRAGDPEQDFFVPSLGGRGAAERAGDGGAGGGRGDGVEAGAFDAEFHAEAIVGGDDAGQAERIGVTEQREAVGLAAGAGQADGDAIVGDAPRADAAISAGLVNAFEPQDAVPAFGAGDEVIERAVAALQHRGRANLDHCLALDHRGFDAEPGDGGGIEHQLVDIGGSERKLDRGAVDGDVHGITGAGFIERRRCGGEKQAGGEGKSVSWAVGHAGMLLTDARL
ncbi:MAG: hypothetical protein ACOYKQ_12295 [Polymorphobacter sp.]